MKNNWRKSNIFIVLIVVEVVVFLSACAPAQPQVDPNLVYTQAAETVSAQLALTQAAVPPATQTPEPSATVELPTATVVVMVPTFTPLALQQTTNTPPATPTQIRAGGDQAKWAYTTPSDGSEFKAGQTFPLAIGLENTGSTTWTQEYKLIYAGGTQISSQTSLSYDPAGGDKLTIPPGEKAEFIMLATAPLDPGSYKSTWFFKNPAGGFIYEVYFPFTVVK